MSRTFRLQLLRQWRSIGAGVRPWISVVEMPSYLARAHKLLTEVEQEAIVLVIAKDPTRGVLVQGTGGVRKLRFGAGRRGKRGGVRVIYFFHSDRLPALLLTVFAKNEKGDLTKAERNDMAAVVASIKGFRR